MTGSGPGRAMPETQPPRRCVRCGKPVNPAHRPFCSRRCADIDLGHWLDGRYRIATGASPEDEPPHE